MAKIQPTIDIMNLELERTWRSSLRLALILSLEMENKTYIYIYAYIYMSAHKWRLVKWALTRQRLLL